MKKTEQAGVSANGATIEDALVAWGELRFREDALGRDAEEREWQEAGLFFQRRQWLDWKEGERRYTQIKPSRTKPRPMPVSNYFAKTINANANALGAEPVRVSATPKGDDEQTRRASQYAEIAKDAIDIESNIRLLNPLLAKHTALWGIGCTKETIDTSEDAQAMDEEETESTRVLGCLDCGQVNEMEPGDSEDESLAQQEIPCPDCQSMQTVNWTRQQPVTVSTYVTGKGKIKTEVRPIWEVYLPRDVQNANLAPRIIHRYRRPLSEIKRKFGKLADDMKSDDPATNTSETRYDILRTLSSYTFAERVNAETATLTEVWVKWDQLPERLQDAIEDALEPDEDDEESLYEDDDDEEDGLSALTSSDPEVIEEMKSNGVFWIYSQGRLLQWGPNTFVDPDSEEKFWPFTFYLWELDPASVYPKGNGADLVPLQKRLNRLDSLIELSFMSNASGKWLWPTTQNNMKPPNGDPSDVVQYDPIGDGKIAPQFMQPSPIHAQAWTYRASILADFQELGLTSGVATGNASSQSTFRTVAYLGAKASEQLSTQRYLWESAHCLRYRKCLALAKLYWDEERSVKIAGPNGRYLFESFTGESLRGDYEIEYVKNSSIPKTLDEKLEMIESMIAGGMVDITDPSTRQYIYSLVNLDGLNLANELQYRKAERDLDAIKRGEMPHESPYQDWSIEFKIVSLFTLTEEFEALDPTLQAYVLAFCEYCNQHVVALQQQQMMQQLAMSGMGAPGGAGGPIQFRNRGKSSSDDPNNRQLAKVPGVTGAPQAAESAAASQGSDFASQMGA
jgi:hypothetical protein